MPFIKQEWELKKLESVGELPFPYVHAEEVKVFRWSMRFVKKKPIVSNIVRFHSIKHTNVNDNIYFDVKNENKEYST